MNSATRNARAGLWEKAKDLPQATDADFFGASRRPAGADPQLLRIINDTSLRTRLIDAGIAEGLQSPKGPQKIPSIVRLYPNFDAPGKDAASRPGPAPPAARTAYGLPTVGELDALLTRIHATEAEVSTELHSGVNAEIAALKGQIGGLEDDEFERAVHELDRLLSTRKALARQIREEAFRRIDADASFEPRRYLRLISREPTG